MNIRTLSKEDTIHLINLSCMVLAWGVTCFYFDASAPTKAVASMGDALLSPFRFAEMFSHNFFNVPILKNPLVVFTVLWISYFLIGMHLSNFLMVKNHDARELKSWYFTRKSH